MASDQGRSAEPPIRVLVLDDNRLSRNGICAALRGEGFRIVGAVVAIDEAVALARTEQVDVAIVDIRLVPGSREEKGLVFLESTDPAVARIRKIVLTAYPAVANFLSALAAGAAAYVRKDEVEYQPSLDELVCYVAKGGRWFDPTTVEELVDYIDWPKVSAANPGIDAATRLTQRELDVLEQIVLRRTNKQISDELDISEHTVKTHVRHILEKLQVSGRHEAVYRAISRGLVKRE